MLVVGSPLDMAGWKTEKGAQAILGPQNLTVFEKILILTGAEWSSVLVAGLPGAFPAGGYRILLSKIGIFA